MRQPSAALALIAAFFALAAPAAATAEDAAPAEHAAPSFDADSFFSDQGSGASSMSGVAAAGGSRLGGLSFSGVASADAVYGVADPFDEEAVSDTSSGVVSLELDVAGGGRDSSKLEASAIVRMIYGDAAAAARAAAALATGSPATAAYLLGSDGAVMSLELKKLYLSAYTRFADISVGRMIINYGRGTAFSPIDLYSSVDASDIELGRTGTDAARILVPFGNVSGLDLVSTLVFDIGDVVAGGRLFGNVAGWDIAASAYGDGLADGDGDLVVGIDFKGDAVVGVSGEAVARLPIADWGIDQSEAVYSLMLGADYSIGGAWLFDAEYLWNASAGSGYAQGTFRAAHNVFASISWIPDELTTVDARCIAAPGLDAVQGTLSVARSVANGARLIAYAVYRAGDIQGRYLGSDDPEAGDSTLLAFGLRLTVAY